MNADDLNLLLAQGRTEAERQFDPLVDAYLLGYRKAGREMARRVRDSEPAAVVADTSGPQPPTLDELLAAALIALGLTSVSAFRRKAAQAAMSPLTAAVDETPSPERLTYVMQKLSSRADEMIAGLRDPVNKALTQAVAESLSIRQTARLIQASVEEVAPWQANLIARTDIMAISNLASDQAVKQLNTTFRAAGETEFSYKTWQTSLDERVRPTHAAAQGQTVKIDQPFVVGASTLMFPCDPSASPDETWACRCVSWYSERATLTASVKPWMFRLTDNELGQIAHIPAADVADPFLTDLTAHLMQPIEEPARADAMERFIIRCDPETAKKYMEWTAGFYALPLEERRAQIADMLIPPLAPLPSPETQEDTMSATETGTTSEAFISLTPQFGVGVFADGSSHSGSPIAFIPITPATEVFVNEGNTTAAVTITVSEEAAEAVGDPIPWEGILAVEGVPTDDSTMAPRILLPDSVGHRELPLPLMAQLETADGHDGARVCGQIQTISRVERPDLGEGAFAIVATGEFDASEFGHEIARLVGEKTLRGVSIDLVAAKYQIVTVEDHEVIPDDEVDLDVLMNGGYLLGLVSGDIGAATVCPLQALADATISLTASGEERATILSSYGLNLTDVTLVASAAPLAPPRDWFYVPEPHEVTPMTITKDGQVYGHAATWDCHEGFRDRCMMAPRSRTNLAYFHTGEIETAEGDLIPIGKWTARGPHAPINLSRTAAREHYDNCSAVVAFVRAVEGRHGIWVSGALKSDATPEQIRDARANAPSGDWRDGELILVHSVPVQGLPVLRHEARVMVASDGQETVAALITPPVEDCGCEDEMSIAEYEIRIEALGQLAGISEA